MKIFKAFFKSKSAAIAVEFALVFPLMLTILTGSLFISDMIKASYKTSQIANSLAELFAGRNGINLAHADHIFGTLDRHLLRGNPDEGLNAGIAPYKINMRVLQIYTFGIGEKDSFKKYKNNAFYEHVFIPSHPRYRDFDISRPETCKKFDIWLFTEWAYGFLSSAHRRVLKAEVVLAFEPSFVTTLVNNLFGPLMKDGRITFRAEAWARHRTGWAKPVNSYDPTGIVTPGYGTCPDELYAPSSSS
jgi:TadE-like protein